MQSLMMRLLICVRPILVFPTILKSGKWIVWDLEPGTLREDVTLLHDMLG